ncbi:MAG TPA: DUF2914 domain-containing protein [Burkholderiales bacterium]
MKKILAACALLALAVAVPAFAEVHVTEAKLGKRVVDRKITGETAIYKARDRAYLWLRVEGTNDDMLTVAWKVNDLVFPVELKINGDPWRTWASKTLHIVGDWTVTVTSSGGKTLHVARFKVK